MLPKKNRADKKAIERIFKEGKVFNSPFLTFRFLVVPKDGKRVSFIVPKNVVKSAVERNHLRRLGYFAFKDFLNDFPAGIVGIFTYKKRQSDILVIKNEIKKILNKIN